MRFEGMPRPGKKPESGGGLSPEALAELNRASNELQARVALAAYAENHPDVSVDALDPDANPSEIRGKAMGEWFSNGSAAAFGEYREKEIQQGHSFRVGSARDIQDVLAQIRPRNQGIVDEDETIH